MTGSPSAVHRPLPRFLSITEIAEQLGLSTKTIRRWINRGELPSHLLGRQRRVSQTDLELFLHQRRQ